MQIIGDYDVIVAGAGVTGIVASVAAAREGAEVLLVESSGTLGGLITGGRLTKPTGLVQPGVYRELIERAAGLGGADPAVRQTYWGSYSGSYDAEVMQRTIIELIDEAGVNVLLFAHVTGAIKSDHQVVGLNLQTKAGPAIVMGRAFVDSSGDGDVAVAAGADFMFGRTSDGRTQPMTSYFRVLEVDFAQLAADCLEHTDDMWEVVVPEEAQDNRDYALNFLCTGFTHRISQAKEDGFDWIVPKNHITIKAGMLTGEASINVTRVQGNALDPFERSHAVLEVRRQAYCAFDFLRRYVRGFEGAKLLEIAPTLGVRETRRIRGDYVLTEDDVRNERRFTDAIGLCNAPIDVHDPGGEEGYMDSVGSGYGIPYSCLLPAGVDGLLVAGRPVSADAIAFGSTRNTPACSLTGQAAGLAAARASAQGKSPRDISVEDLQGRLEAMGVVLGTEKEDVLAEAAG